MSTTKRPRSTGSAQIDSLKTKGRSAAAGSAAPTQTEPRGGSLVVTLTIYRAARLEAPKTQTRATEMLEIIGRIADWAGGEKQAMAWYRAEPIAAFGGRTAESLVKDGKASAVRDYLDHVATGGFA